MSDKIVYSSVAAFSKNIHFLHTHSLHAMQPFSRIHNYNVQQPPCSHPTNCSSLLCAYFTPNQHYKNGLQSSVTHMLHSYHIKTWTNNCTNNPRIKVQKSIHIKADNARQCVFYCAYAPLAGSSGQETNLWSTSIVIFLT